MKLDPYIHELLFHHDCVIIPEFGGFVGNYQPAKIDNTNQKIHPPKKSIGFNIHLKKNDGLLTNYIASKQNINYQEALQAINQSVSTINNHLKQNKKYHFDKIGTVYIDAHQQIQFEPDDHINYLADAYGLTSISFIPIAKKETATPKVVALESKPKKWIAAAVFVPLTAALMWFSWQNNTIKHQIASANILPFESATIHYEANSNTTTFEEIQLVENNLADNNNGITHLSFYNDLPPIPVALYKRAFESVRETTYVKPASIQKNAYHVIGGCFSSKQNAEKLLSDLKNAGFDAYILPEKHKNLYAVAYGGATTKHEAKNLLSSAKSKHNHKAWILSK